MWSNKKDLKLSLKNSNLSELKRAHFPELRLYTEIDLSGNKIAVIQNLKTAERCKVLDVSSNLLSEVGQESLPKNLREISLARNQLSDFSF